MGRTGRRISWTATAHWMTTPSTRLVACAAPPEWDPVRQAFLQMRTKPPSPIQPSWNAHSVSGRQTQRAEASLCARCSAERGVGMGLTLTTARRRARQATTCGHRTRPNDLHRAHLKAKRWANAITALGSESYAPSTAPPSAFSTTLSIRQFTTIRDAGGNHPKPLA